MKMFTEHLFNSVNTGRNINIATGSEQFVNEGRKNVKNLFNFSVFQVWVQVCVEYPSPKSFRSSSFSLKNKVTWFLISVRVHKGLFAVTDEIFKEIPGGLWKLELGKGEKEKETHAWTQESVLATRDVMFMRWPKRRKYLERTEKYKAEITGFKGACLTKSFLRTCKNS